LGPEHAVGHLVDLVGGIGDGQVVGNHDNAVVLIMGQVPEYVHDPVAVGSIQAACPWARRRQQQPCPVESAQAMATRCGLPTEISHLC